VGFSHNPYRWTPQIDRRGGFLRIVWGLGTRAVDRVAGDHPRMVALSHPTLRPERNPAEIQRYSQHCIDVIDLAKLDVVSYPVTDVIRYDVPGLRHIASVMDGGDILPLHMTDPRIPAQNYVLTFDGLLRNARFVTLMRTMLRRLEDAYAFPVDTEFTVDLLPGPELDFRIHLLQCRPQAQGRPAKEGETFLPRDVPEEAIVFASSRTVCSGKVDNIRYVVFVDPERYSRLSSTQLRVRIAQVCGTLNERLKGNSFILVGPGRWGSSNPELGVPVSYADIFNVDALVEVPMAIRDEEPEASYGTHFFQDLIESEIFPVAVYPGKDDDRIDFPFFRQAPNALRHFAPEAEDVAELVKVIDVPAYTSGKVLELAMEAGPKEAMLAFLKFPKS
ncbi:MAG: PEP/pyruvate-binding domain-containing protein, partial [Polyangiaceae bacterium]|nr:PEP/pyruvate-binding domain-containing protein [Polyangiaceae bacterium]